MSSRETAARLGIAATGSARAYAPGRRAAGAHAQHRDPARHEQARRHDRRRRRRLPAAHDLERPGRLDDRVHVRHQPRATRSRAARSAARSATPPSRARRSRCCRASTRCPTTCSGRAPATAARSSRWWCRWVGRRCARARTSAANERRRSTARQRRARARADARAGFEQAQVAATRTELTELNINHDEPSLLRSTRAQKLAAVGIVDGRRASAELSDFDDEVVGRRMRALFADAQRRRTTTPTPSPRASRRTSCRARRRPASRCSPTRRPSCSTSAPARRRR